MNKFRYGFANMDFNRIKEAKAAGADYQELSFRGLYDLTDDEVNQYLNLSNELNLPFETANGMFPSNIKVVGPDVDYDKIDEFLDNTFAKAKKLGIKIVVFGSGKARNIPDGFDKSVAFNQLIVFLRDHVNKRLMKYDMMCVLENLSYNECNTLNTVEEMYNLVKAVESVRVKILIDFFHFGFNKDSEEWLKIAGNYIHHIHVASVLNQRHFPAPDDGEDYGKIVSFLKNVGYENKDARITFEAKIPDGKTFETCAAESLNVFKNL